MITDSFDYSRAIIEPEHFYGPRGKQFTVCLVLYSHVINEVILERYECRKAVVIHACNGETPVYVFHAEGMEIGFYLSNLGATMAGNDLIEASWLTGADHFIAFGSAGALRPEETAGRFVVPTEAYRDEGMSYHYCEPSDYITMRNAAFVASVMEKNAFPYVQGRVWTTDALYRETEVQVKKRTDEGCLAVEMELAGLQAVCDYHHLQLYSFLSTGDVLTGEAYDSSGLYAANHDLDKLHAALAVAREIQELRLTERK